MGFRAGNDGVPHRVGAGGEALERIRDHVQHLAVVALDFIAGIAQHQSAAGRWRQKFFDAFKAVLVQHGYLPASFQLGHVTGQRTHVRGVEFKQLELVMPAQQALADEGRAGVHPGFAALVEGPHHVYIRCQSRSEGRHFGGDQAQDAVRGFCAGAGVVAIQPVEARAGVGIQNGQRRVFLREILQGGNQNRVLEHIGMVACVECVAITEHARMVTIAYLDGLEC